VYTIAPDIFRKRLLIEGYFTASVDEKFIDEFFAFITGKLDLKTYGVPIIHKTAGVGKAANQGYDAFVPLIDSGIYLGVWSHKQFLSLIIYTCKDFDETKALRLTKEYFSISSEEHKLF
jgi:hypothetical protein